MNMGWFGVELDCGLLRACSFPQRRKPRMFQSHHPSLVAPSTLGASQLSPRNRRPIIIRSRFSFCDPHAIQMHR